MKVAVPLLGIVALLFAGCFGGSADGCPSDELAAEVFEGAAAYFETLEGERFSARIEGTLEGDVGTVLVILDPENERMRYQDTSDEGYDERYDGIDYSYEDDETSFYGRDHHPKGAMHRAYEEFIQLVNEDEGVSFLADEEVAEYETECLEIGGQKVIQFSREDGTEKETLVAQSDPPYRPVSEEVVDPALQNNYRSSFSFDIPKVTIDKSGARYPATLSIDVVDSYLNDDGSTYTSARLKDDSEWVPLDELLFRVEDDTTIYDWVELADGEWQLDGAIFRYTDRDGNGKFSSGDTFSMDVAAGVDGYFYDNWADDYTLTPE